MTRFTNPVPKYTDQSGDFMPFGLLYFFESGTNDDKTTFADVNETIENTQPLILNGDGSVPNCFYSGSAKVILVTNAGTPTAPADGVQQWERDPVTSASIGSIGRVWDAVSIYDKNSVVIHDDVFYVSIINNNQNNNPSSSPAAWSQFDLLNRFNINETYQLGDPVTASDGFLYTSLITDNTGNDPTSTSGFWTLPLVLVPNSENLLINGDFDFWQRGTNFSPAANEYTADRWWSTVNTSVVQAGVTKPVGSTFAGSLTPNAGFPVQVRTSVELLKAGEAGPLAVGSIFTLSGSFRVPVGKTLTVQINFADTVPGNLNPSIVLGPTIIHTGTGSFVEEELTFTISASPNVTNTCMFVQFLGETDDSIIFSQIKLEQGSASTPFTRAGNTLAGELAMCQRYYFTLASTYQAPLTNDVATERRINIQYPVTMRTPPTVGGLVSSFGTPALVSSGVDGARIQITGVLASNQTTLSGLTADAEL